jgi:hypothetical protein
LYIRSHVIARYFFCKLPFFINLYNLSLFVNNLFPLLLAIQSSVF